jgi:ribosome-associated protein
MSETKPPARAERRKIDLTADQTAEQIRSILADKKALDIEIIDLEGKTILADRFVIATGTSVTHIKALAGEVEKIIKEQHQRLPDRVEGQSTGRWILMDYADVVVHLFHAEERQFYSLEKLWRASRA